LNVAQPEEALVPMQLPALALPLAAVTQNPAGAAALTAAGVILMLILAVVAVGVWVVVALGRARRADREFAESAAAPELAALRQERLVVRGAETSGPQPAVVAQLEPSPEPPAPTPAPEI
jgi:hypothetical protein